MKKTSVYDLPTRVFHWLLVILFLTAFIIAESVGDESTLFSYHMMAGLTIAILLILRLIWGFTGTTYARFSSFKWKPSELIQYAKDVVVDKTKRYMGHNPASSYAALVMFICAIGLTITGIIMTAGSKNEFLGDIHSVLADIFLATVVLHVAGIIFHHIKHQDSLWSSMIDGKKGAIEGEHGIVSLKPVIGALFLAITILWIGYLNMQYNTNTRTLDLFGNQLKLGENEHEPHPGLENHREVQNDDD